jgi:hypothetical protein
MVYNEEESNIGVAMLLNESVSLAPAKPDANSHSARKSTCSSRKPEGRSRLRVADILSDFSLCHRDRGLKTKRC